MYKSIVELLADLKLISANIIIKTPARKHNNLNKKFLFSLFDDSRKQDMRPINGI